MPPREADQRGNPSSANGNKSDPTSDLAKTVAVGTGAGLAATGATAAGVEENQYVILQSYHLHSPLIT